MVGFKVLGHAGFGEHGQDIVCAGVSALAQGALLGLQDVLGNQVSYCRQPGYLEASVVPEDAAEDAPRAILRTLELGLLSIAKAYSGYVEVTYQGVD
ncbi:MAG: ribosomal-processing cysteine protease Prp [Bacillota bacterium]